MHIRIYLGTKFQLKLTVFIFLDQIFTKIVFQVKHRKIALLRVSMDIVYYIKVFLTGTNMTVF